MMQVCKWCGASYENYDHEAGCVKNPGAGSVGDWLKQVNQQSPQGQSIYSWATPPTTSGGWLVKGVHTPTKPLIVTAVEEVKPPAPKPAPEPCPSCGGQWSHKFGCPQMQSRQMKEQIEKEMTTPPTIPPKSVMPRASAPLTPTICPYCAGKLIVWGNLKQQQYNSRFKTIRRNYKCSVCGRFMQLKTPRPRVAKLVGGRRPAPDDGGIVGW